MQVTVKTNQINAVTKYRPVVFWPDIISRALSLASSKNLRVSFRLAVRTLWAVFCFASFPARRRFFWRPTTQDTVRHRSTISTPASNEQMLDNKKTHHLRSLRHSVSFDAANGFTSDIAWNVLVNACGPYNSGNIVWTPLTHTQFYIYINAYYYYMFV